VRFSRALLVVLFFLAGQGACGSRAKLGDACAADGDCADGLACYQKQCLQENNVKQMRAAEAHAGDATRRVGDKIEVEWRGAYKPATVVGVVAPGSYRVHFEGFDAQWDEVVGEARIKGARN